MSRAIPIVEPDPDFIIDQLAELPGEVTDKLLTEAERLAEGESVEFENQDLRISIQLKKAAMISTPRQRQRTWLLNRVLRETSDDLAALDRIAGNFVPGNASPHLPRDLSVERLSDQEIMEDWQTPLMQSMTEWACQTRGDVLEIGFGRGVAATMIQNHKVRSHTIIEMNRHCIDDHFEPWVRHYKNRSIRLLEGRWQDVLDQLSQYDTVFFHAFPMNEDEFIRYVLHSATFAEHFFPVASRLLRAGGAFTYLSTEIDSLSRRHQRSLLEHFSEIQTRVQPLSIPRRYKGRLVGRFDGIGEGNQMISRSELEDRVRALDEHQLRWLAQTIATVRKPRQADGRQSDGLYEDVAQELVAWIQCDEHLADLSFVREEIRRQLPPSLVPNQIRQVDRIPRTSNGKIDRRGLPELDHHHLPIQNADDQRTIEDWTNSERKLVLICRSLLKCDEISPSDNFFDAGGDSMLSIRLIAIARNEGIEIEPTDVLAAKSISALAQSVDRRTQHQSSEDRFGADSDMDSGYLTVAMANVPVVSKIRSGDCDASILMVHEVGGHCGYAQYLTNELSKSHAIYVTNQPPPGESRKTIEELAELYVDGWIDLNARGKKSVIAFCWGGPLAYQIAKELKRRRDRGRAIIDC